MVAMVNDEPWLDRSVPQWKQELILRKRVKSSQITLPNPKFQSDKREQRVLNAVRDVDGSKGGKCEPEERAVDRSHISGSDFHLQSFHSYLSTLGSGMHGVEPVLHSSSVRGNMKLLREDMCDNDIRKICRKFDYSSNSDGALGNYLKCISDMSSGAKDKKAMGKRLKPKERSSLPAQFVANGTKEDACLSDSSEEIHYGPGIVNKLKSKYLSMTLRDNKKVRPALRKANSLDNLLDENFVECPLNSVIDSVHRIESHCVEKESLFDLKKARSMELLHENASNSNNDVNPTNVSIVISKPKSFSHYKATDEKNLLEEKKLLEHLDISSMANDDVIIVENSPSKTTKDTDLPPPDVVKETLKLFEGEKPRPPKKFIPPKSKPPIPAKPVLYPKPTILKDSCIKKCTSTQCEPEKDFSASCSIVTNGFVDTCYISSNLTVNENIIIEDRAPISVLKVNFEVNNTISRITKMPVEKFSQKSKPPEMAEVPKKFQEVSGDFEDLSTPEKLQQEEPRAPEIVNECIKKVPEQRSPLGCRNEPVKQIGVIKPLMCEIPKNDAELTSNVEESPDPGNEPEEPSDCVLKPSTLPVAPTTSALWGKKVWNQNTVVFNFSNREGIPDYIENDGMILRSKRFAKSNADGSRILLLNNGGSSDDIGESSTDATDKEWQLMAGPPSPCDFQFEGECVLINGKSNLKKHPKEKRHLKIQFNDTSTTYEYPSEASLLQEEQDNKLSNGDVTAEPLSAENGMSTQAQYPSPSLPTKISSSIIGGGNLASYVPSKMGLNESFQLGVTRKPNSMTCRNNNKNSTDEFRNDEYLKPAEEIDNVAWSEESSPDLLF